MDLTLVLDLILILLLILVLILGLIWVVLKVHVIHVFCVPVGVTVESPSLVVVWPLSLVLGMILYVFIFVLRFLVICSPLWLTVVSPI